MAELTKGGMQRSIISDMTQECNKCSSAHVLIITPLFWGDSSGASVYYQLLARELVGQGCKVSVVSDREQARSALPIGYVPLFPARCARSKRPVLDLVLYLWQNILYFRLFGLIKKLSPDVVLIHSSFYNHPGVFAAVARVVMNVFSGIKFIADVRDALMPRTKVPLLNAYDNIIACSDNVSNYLRDNGINTEKLSIVPVIQEPITIRKGLAEELRSEFQINEPYIFYGGLVKESKGVDLLLEAFLEYIRPSKNISLVISGLLKSTNVKMKNMLSQDGVIYIGNQPRENVLALMDKADLCVNLSPSEGMPRGSLEAVALRRPVVLPPNVPEFGRFSDENVMYQRDPSSVAAKMLEILNAGESPSYPLEMHAPENVIKKYLSVFSS